MRERRTTKRVNGTYNKTKAKQKKEMKKKRNQTNPPFSMLVFIVYTFHFRRARAQYTWASCYTLFMASVVIVSSVTNAFTTTMLGALAASSTVLSFSACSEGEHSGDSGSGGGGGGIAACVHLSCHTSMCTGYLLVQRVTSSTDKIQQNIYTK